MAQQSEAKRSPLESYILLADWLPADGNAFFPTRSSLDWFIKMNRDELVRRGALLPREGRSGSLVERQRFARVVLDIFKRRAADKMKVSAG